MWVSFFLLLVVLRVFVLFVVLLITEVSIAFSFDTRGGTVDMYEETGGKHKCPSCTSLALLKLTRVHSTSFHTCAGASCGIYRSSP